MIEAFVLGSGGGGGSGPIAHITTTGGVIYFTLTVCRGCHAVWCWWKAGRRVTEEVKRDVERMA